MAEDRLIRITEVCEITSLSRSKIYNLIREGSFPPQRRVSHRIAVWPLSKVRTWAQQHDEDILI